MPEQHATPDERRLLSARVHPDTRRRLRRLAAEWDCQLKEAIDRAVEIAERAVIGSDGSK